MSQATQPSVRDADTFDYVIVGSGAAGSILANRLSADGSTVCVLEAGPPDNSPFLHIPAGFIKAVFNKKYAWQFSSEGTAQTNGRRVPIPQGRTLGGSTSINGLVYNRGQAADFDHWAALGNTGWSYVEVLPYFKSMERRVGGDDRYRGRKGELPVTDIDWIHPLCEAFIAGAVEQGIPRNPDYNGADQAGVGYFQRTIDRGWRMSTAKCFLKPAMARKNLEVRTYAQATRILFEGAKAVGVAYCHPAHPSQARAVRARREVIVSCGAINTPKLLQLSGLGPADLLRQHNIEVVRDLAGVGENLSDHYSVRVVARVKNSQTMNQLVKGLSLAGQISRWLMKRPSIMALSPSLLHYFWKSTPDLTAPDLQGVFTPRQLQGRLRGHAGRLSGHDGRRVAAPPRKPRPGSHPVGRSAAGSPHPGQLPGARGRPADPGARHPLGAPVAAFAGPVAVLRQRGPAGPAVRIRFRAAGFRAPLWRVVLSRQRHGPHGAGRGQVRGGRLPAARARHPEPARHRFVGNASHAFGQYLRGHDDDRQQGRRLDQAILKNQSAITPVIQKETT